MKIVIVGSGPSSVAAASVLVGYDHAIDMIDFGNKMEDKSRKLLYRFKSNKASANDLELLRKGFKHNTYQKAKNKEILPLIETIMRSDISLEMNKKRLFGSSFVYKDIEKYIKLTENSPQLHRSLAKGGLSNVWGAACYPFIEHDFRLWPFSKNELDPHYLSVNNILQLNERDDYLSKIYSVYNLDKENIELNPQSFDLLNRWYESKEKLSNDCIFFGQSRLAVLTQEKGGRKSCQYCGLCLYGCPHGAIYSSKFTVDNLNKHKNFSYKPGLFLRRFKELANGKVLLEVEDVRNREINYMECDSLFIGAGTLSTLRMVADSSAICPEKIPVLENDLFLLPLIKMSNWHDFNSKIKFTLSELVIILNNQSICDEIIHAQLYSYSDYIFDRFSGIIETLPGVLKRKMRKVMFNTFIMFAYLHSKYSADLKAKVIKNGVNGISNIDISFQRNNLSDIIINRFIKVLRKNKKELNLYPLKIGLRHTEPGTASHIGGTLPMKKNPGPFETYDNGLLYGHKSVYIIDQSTFPDLPAQNITYTAMANAHRIAAQFSLQANH